MIYDLIFPSSFNSQTKTEETPNEDQSICSASSRDFKFHRIHLGKEPILDQIKRTKVQ